MLKKKKSKVAETLPSNLWLRVPVIKEKFSIPVDVRPPKTPLLKLPIDVLSRRIYVNGYQIWSTLAGY